MNQNKKQMNYSNYASCHENLWAEVDSNLEVISKNYTYNTTDSATHFKEYPEISK